MGEDNWSMADLARDEPLPGEDAQQFHDRMRARQSLKPSKTALAQESLRSYLIDSTMAKTGLSREDAEKAVKDEAGI